jgi:hypothetical protein
LADGNRPGFAGGGRPSTGDLGDFLGMDRPISRPGLADNRPGFGDGRPGFGDNRPGIADGRPGIADGRPGIGNRPNRPINIGNDVNFNVNNRNSWNNIDRNRYTNVQNRWTNAVGNRRGDYFSTHRDRYDHWHGWGDSVRDNWYGRYHGNNFFGSSWWDNHYAYGGGWHYHYCDHDYGWNDWWVAPTFAATASFFSWPTTPIWQEPVYYDYGQGGNVVYQDNSVYIDGQQVASAEDFAMSAAELATVEPPATPEQAEAAEWMPLGTFAVSASEQEGGASRVIQLAVSKEGIISGTLYNIDTDQAQAVQGQVDKETQRVAFRIGDSDSIVVETGLFNLTQAEAPVLVHFGTERSEDYLLVRLDQPASDDRPEGT